MAYHKNKLQTVRSRQLLFHREWAERQWKRAFCDDWDYEYLLQVIRAKLVTMERYNMHLSYALNGPYYGHQIQRAIQMIDIVLAHGGDWNDYDKRDENDFPIPESFQHYVNMRNRERIPRPADGGILFWSDAQCLRFDKAWMLLWKILSEKAMTWGD